MAGDVPWVYVAKNPDSEYPFIYADDVTGEWYGIKGEPPLEEAQLYYFIDQRVKEGQTYLKGGEEDYNKGLDMANRLLKKLTGGIGHTEYQGSRMEPVNVGNGWAIDLADYMLP